MWIKNGTEARVLSIYLVFESIFFGTDKKCMSGDSYKAQHLVRRILPSSGRKEGEFGTEHLYPGQHAPSGLRKLLSTVLLTGICTALSP
jgi:hypothetical protein